MSDPLGTPTPDHPDKVLIEGCASGDRPAQRALMQRLLPVLHAQVLAVTRRAPSGHSIVRREVQDLVQDVLVELLRNEAKELRRWDPSRGLTLEGFARLVARRFAVRRVLGRRPEVAQTTEPALLEATRSSAPDDRVEHRNELDVILDGLYAQMTPRDRELFERIFLAEQSADVVIAQMQITPAALKKWRSRLYGRARQIAHKARSGPSLRQQLDREKPMSPCDEGEPTSMENANSRGTR